MIGIIDLSEEGRVERIPSSFERVKSYKMTREGWDSYWELRISKTRKRMREDISNFRKKEEYKTLEDIEHIYALVMPLSVFSRDQESGKFYEDLKFAVMFLNEENMEPEVIAHESLHLAMCHERFIRFNMNYENNSSIRNEERLAYFLMDCVKSVNVAAKYKK